MEKYIVNPVQVRMKESAKGSIYQSIVAMGIRSRQVNDYIKNELTERMADVVTVSTEETDEVNYDQINISKEFERLPKPTFIAMREIFDGKLTYQMADNPTD
ncbi:MAG: hypothetical protein Kapaf2KO_14460 [Candidatus Kapaibacteriales bacterium]